jgi:branched-chain amino acid transport system permease protein
MSSEPGEAPVGGAFSQSTPVESSMASVQVKAWNAGRSGIGSSHLVTFLLMVAFFIVAPFFVYPIFLMKGLCFALFACALNLVFGYVGLLSFGHAAFFGFAAYICGYFAQAYGLPPAAAVLCGAAVAALLGVVIGALAIRCRGIYFAMITLALAQMIYFVCLRSSFTGGENGLQNIPRGMLFGTIDLNDTMTIYFVVLAVFLGGFLLIYRTAHSPFGHVLRAIRENEPRAKSLGYTVDHYKLVAFVLSAALSGVAGSVKAIVFQVTTLSDVHWMMSGEVVLMVIVGGIGTMFGPVVGAFLLVAMESYLAQIGTWLMVVQGLIFMVCVLAFRRGIVGELAALTGKAL